MKTKNLCKAILTISALALLAATKVPAQILPPVYNYSLILPGNRSSLVANQLDCAGGNTLANVFSNQLPSFTYVYFWKCCNQDPADLGQLSAATNYDIYIYDNSDPAGLGTGVVWYRDDDFTPIDASSIYVNPGQGVFVKPSATVTLNFTGTPHVPVLPATLPCGCGHWNLLSRQTNDVGTYQNVTGLAPMEGAQVERWNFATQAFTNYIFSGGVWSPSAPNLGVGEAAFFLVPCITNCISIDCSDIITNGCGTNVFVNFHPVVTNICCTNINLSYDHGNWFVPGTTNTVTCWASDGCGNSNYCTFTVTVLKRHSIDGLFNTGVDDNGALLGGGQLDGHYALVFNPSGTDGARVVDSTYILGAWLANNGASQWIGPQTNTDGVAFTNYQYRLTFNLCCTNDVIITGRWAADNAGAIWLNNSPIADPGGTLAYNVSDNFTNWHTFTITNGFLAGQNTLDFWVTNYTHYTALRVELGGTAACCSNIIQIQAADIVTNSCTNLAVYYQPTATDTCCTNLTVWCDPPSGHVFAAGTTNTVTCWASDACDNVTSTTFTVTVLKRRPIAGLFNTGVDDNRNLLGGGNRDYHYALGVNPDGEAFFVVVNTNATVMQAWLADSAVSQWISPRSDGNGYAGSTAYDYQVRFTLRCTNDAIITGRWAADNSGSIVLNSNSIADPGGRLSGNEWTNFSAWHAFTITGGFVAGTNTLDFWVTNSSGYTGLRVELSGTSACCCSNNAIQISCSDIITNSDVAVVLTNYPVTVTDDCCSNLTVWYVPAPPHSFASGESNSVTCWASDCAGNLASNTFAVVVVPGPSSSVFKANNTNSLNQATSWTNNVVPSANNFAVWNSIVAAPNTTNNLGSDQTWGGIQILDPAAPIVITGSNTLTLNGVSGIAIDLSNAVQNLTIHCPVTVASNQTWAVASSRMLTVDSLLVNAPFQIGGAGRTHINTMEGAGIYPVDFNGSSYTEIGPVSGGLSFQVDGAATLALTGSNSFTGPLTVNGGTLILQATSNNTFGGVCYALNTNNLALNDGATLQLLADGSNTVFGAGTVLTATNATVTLSAGPLTPGQTNRTLTFGGSLNLSNATINVTDGGDILVLGPIASSGSFQIGGFGRKQIGGIHGDGVYPVDFNGSSYGSPSEIEWSFGDSSTCGAIANTGGLNKLGNDVLVLTGTNTYTGPTVVSAGALVVNGSLLGGGPVTVAGGTLHGSGVITGPVAVQANACIAVDGMVLANLGSDGIDRVDMTVSNNLSLAGTAWMGINRTNTHNSDRLSGISTVTYGGTLTVTNRGPALQAGDTFMLFSARSFFDVFTEMNLPALNPGLAWNTSQLAVNGTLGVVATNPTNITFGVNGSTLSLSWPADHTGWHLEMQTNSLATGLNTNWFTVPDSNSTNMMVLPINPAAGAAFYRLRYP